MNIENKIRKIVRQLLSEGPIWRQGGVLLIKGAQTDGGQRLYATYVKNISEFKPEKKGQLNPIGTPNTPAKNAVNRALIGEDIYRLKYDNDGNIKAVKVNWKNESSLIAMLKFKDQKASVVLNANKTPLYFDTLQFNNIGTMINSMRSRLEQMKFTDNIDFYN